MNTTALIMMITSLSVVTLVTAYYFYHAFTTPPKPIDDGHQDINRPDFT
ncbi:MAG: hypothetical protein KAX72_04990 [Chitinophagales bacterium]|nr:hypothetical protein [Bacteroidota bacterium]MBL0051375.1 hypothetical protein [Bacteroidota bacterium]MBP8249435.1 hypothetical protein [Chitinophagales bacterium]HRC32435.1 hypothetical protein [Bacteroidia bacterium]